MGTLHRVTALVLLCAGHSTHAFASGSIAAPKLHQNGHVALKPAPLARAASPSMAIVSPLHLATVLSTPLGAIGLRGVGIVTAILAVLVTWLVRVLNTPSRVYDRSKNTVGVEYDAWTSEGILEYYWGEHIHLGWYDKGERKGPFYGGKDFVEAKYDFIDKMLEFSETDGPKTILDVGCGIGGTSRTLAKKFPDAQVTGITISKEQQRRATELAKERGIANANFEIVDALEMSAPVGTGAAGTPIASTASLADNSFDLVWACESGEHMPDKKKYVEEMARVLKPGGRIVIATWCQREESDRPFSAKEQKTLDYLYGEWTHPYFISIEEYGRLMEGTGKLDKVVTADWAVETIPAWRHSVWVGVWDPWPVIRRPHLWWKVIRDAWCLEVMHRSFVNGLMQYGMMTATKPISVSSTA